MLEAKDKKYIQDEILRAYPGTDPEIDIDWDIVEISFKAGKEEESTQAYHVGLYDGILRGRKEVIEWVEEHGSKEASYQGLHITSSRLEVPLRMWQFQLKEWEVSNDKRTA